MSLTSAENIRQSFHAQASACARLGSPFMERLCALAAARLDTTSDVGRTILNWPTDPTNKADAIALRFASALHFLAREGVLPALTAAYPPNQSQNDDALWIAVQSAIVVHRATVLNWLKSPPQTNEVRRSSAIVPGLMLVAVFTGKPLVLSEIGASAGLNMCWDSYHFRFGSTAIGPNSVVELCPEWNGPPPPNVKITIADRAGCDLNPLDASFPADCSRLLSYIWPDQVNRLERTSNALRLTAERKIIIDQADAVKWLEKRLATKTTGSAHVIYHTIAWQYLPEDAKKRGEDLISEAGSKATSQAPLARLQMEADWQGEGAALSLQIWPGGESKLVGSADFHGAWVNWYGWPDLVATRNQAKQSLAASAKNRNA